MVVVAVLTVFMRTMFMIGVFTIPMTMLMIGVLAIPVTMLMIGVLAIPVTMLVAVMRATRS